MFTATDASLRVVPGVAAMDAAAAVGACRDVDVETVTEPDAAAEDAARCVNCSAGTAT